MRIKRDVGLSTTTHPRDYDRFFTLCKEAGIKVVELAGSKEAMLAFNPSQIANRIQSEGLLFRSLHLPFGGEMDISILDDTIRREVIESHKRLIKAYSELGVHYFVCHPSGEPIPDEKRQQIMENSKSSLNELANYARDFGSIICVENLPRTCIGRTIEEMKELLDVNDRLRCTFDTNHLMSGETQEEFVLAIGKRIASLHVSDYDFVNERHWIPGEGKIDWVKFMDALDTVGYYGPILYEVSLPCQKTIIRPRDLEPEDFVRNAESLYKREKPEIISTPKPNLGMWE